MTVAALTPSNAYVEDGATLNFPVQFRYLDPADLMVTRQVGTVITPLVLGVDYSATAAPTDAGGTLTLSRTIAGAQLSITRDTARRQGTEYDTSDTFPAASHEAALDRAMLIAQEQDVRTADVEARALTAAPGGVGATMDLSSIAEGDLLQFGSGLVRRLPVAAFAGKAYIGGAGGAPVPGTMGGADAAMRTDLASIYGGQFVSMFNGRSAQSEMDVRAIRIATMAAAAALNLATLYGAAARIIIGERGLVEWVRVTAATAASGQNKWWFTDAGGTKWMIAYTGKINPLNCGAAGGCTYNFSTNVAVGTDDSAYVQAALDYFQTMGWPGTVEFTDLHNIASVQALGATLNAGLHLYGDNVRLQRVGYGRIGCVFSAAVATANYRGLHSTGGGKVSIDAANNRGVDKAGYAPTGPIAARATAVPLVAGGGAHFAAGDLVMIRTGECINPPNGTIYEPDGELNVVLSVAGDVVTLKYPTITGYQQEYFITGATGQTNTTNTTGTAARFELVNVADRIMQGSYIDIDLIGHNCLQVLDLWGVMHCEVADTCRIVHGQNGLGSRESRWVYDGARKTHTGRALGYFSGPSTICADWTVDWWGVSPSSYAYFHVHEGVKRLHMKAVYGVCAGNAGAVNGMIDILARCYEIRCDQAYLDSGTAAQPAIVVGAVTDVQDNYSDGGVSFGLVTHRNANSAGSAILINGANVSFDTDPVALGVSDRISNVTYTRATTYGVRIGSMLFGPLLYDRQLILGQVGQDAQIVEIEQRVDVAFATGDRRFRAGYSGVMSAYVNAQVVNTLVAGDTTVTKRGGTTVNGAAGTSYAGPSIGAPQSGTRQLVCEIDQTSGTTNYTAGTMRVAAMMRRMSRTS